MHYAIILSQVSKIMSFAVFGVVEQVSVAVRSVHVFVMYPIRISCGLDELAVVFLSSLRKLM